MRICVVVSLKPEIPRLGLVFLMALAYSYPARSIPIASFVLKNSSSFDFPHITSDITWVLLFVFLLESIPALTSVYSNASSRYTDLLPNHVGHGSPSPFWLAVPAQCSNPNLEQAPLQQDSTRLLKGSVEGNSKAKPPRHPQIGFAVEID
jgi:hypothetical protein